jgi:tRNA-dihydrouridine synthase A
LDYGRVRRLKKDFPDLCVVLNGGLCEPDTIKAELAHVDGVMIGREAYQNPYSLLPIQRAVFDDRGPVPTRHEIIAGFLPYVECQRAEGVPLHSMTRHILGLFNGQRGARAWRRYLSTNANRDQAGPEVIEAALRLVPEPDDALEAA